MPSRKKPRSKLPGASSNARRSGHLTKRREAYFLASSFLASAFTSAFCCLASAATMALVFVASAALTLLSAFALEAAFSALFWAAAAFLAALASALAFFFSAVAVSLAAFESALASAFISVLAATGAPATGASAGVAANDDTAKKVAARRARSLVMKVISRW